MGDGNGLRANSVWSQAADRGAAARRVIAVLVEPWRMHPLAWIHRAEARAIAAELRATGANVGMVPFAVGVPEPRDTLLLRVSDPVMLEATHALTAAGVSYCGPGAETLARCYDKQQAYAHALAHGVDCPRTLPAREAEDLPRPLVMKPRQGSDSIGFRVLRAGPIPPRYRTGGYLAQDLVHGIEITVALLRDDVGMPLHIQLPQGRPYTFWRKYLWPPKKGALADAGLPQRVRAEAQRIGRMFGIDWAARTDFLYEPATQRLIFLECDAAPLIGRGSAFDISMAAAGMARLQQLHRLLNASG